MRTDTSTHSLERLFGLAQSHSLTMSKTHVETRNGTKFEVQWLEEYNDEQTLVARYRAWSNQSQKPPYRKQRGWERFSTDGQLLDREVRYSMRDNNEWLH